VNIATPIVAARRARVKRLTTGGVIGAQ